MATRGQSMWGPRATIGTWILSQTGSSSRVFAEEKHALIFRLKNDSGCPMKDGFCETPFCESQFSHLCNGLIKKFVKSIAKGFLPWS